jgi:hypothetical protein
MRKVKAVVMDEISRNGNPQILLAIMATCSVSVAKAKQVRTLANP